MADRLGQRLGNYRLIRLLGQGGFADVYLGEHLYLKTLAALKVLHLRLTQDAIEDFFSEARTLVRLEHPHIVRVLECGVEPEQQTPFLVMTYAPGGSLRQRYPRGARLSLEEILVYVRQVADALQYAHDHRLVHRDVKPENILLGQNHEVLLGDFGLVLQTQTSATHSTKELSGTVAYMAPEQLQGRPRPASDQYALGIVVYEWLSGMRPFQGSLVEIASQQLVAPPPSLTTKVQGLAPAIERVVLTALAKDPNNRFPTVLAFADALEQACRDALQRSLDLSLDGKTELGQSMLPTFVKNPAQPAAQPPSIQRIPPVALPSAPIVPPAQLPAQAGYPAQTPTLPPVVMNTPQAGLTSSDASSLPQGSTIFSAYPAMKPPVNRGAQSGAAPVSPPPPPLFVPPVQGRLQAGAARVAFFSRPTEEVAAQKQVYQQTVIAPARRDPSRWLSMSLLSGILILLALIAAFLVIPVFASMAQPHGPLAPTPSSTILSTATATSMPSPTATSTPSPTPRATPTPTPTSVPVVPPVQPTATATPTPRPTPTATPVPTATPTPTQEPKATPTPTSEPTATATPSPTPTEIATPSPSPNATETAIPTQTVP